MPRIIEKTVYTIEEHPNPEAVYGWIRDNWHDLGDFAVEESIVSLKAFAEHIGARVDYSISIVPDRGENIRFSFEYNEPTLGDVIIDLDLSGNCPLTGMCYDENILDAVRDAATDATATLADVLRDVEYNVLKTLHNEGDYLYSDEGLFEMCQANEYEFYENGEIV